MLKVSTPFTGRSVVRGRAAAKFPAAFAMMDEIGCAEGSDPFALATQQPGEQVWFHMAVEADAPGTSRG